MNDTPEVSGVHYSVVLCERREFDPGCSEEVFVKFLNSVPTARQAHRPQEFEHLFSVKQEAITNTSIDLSRSYR